MRAADLLDENGQRARLIDIGRDNDLKPAVVPGPKRSEVAAGTTCFVMQPFVGHLGTYYESLFKPAIEKAGLQPVRADDDMFATGKIMDQVWRGIHQAKVLVAELTSKNPNVFYELGLAHALRKPVVLVSSNEDDVPFDLRHIRVILYDQADPFWGQKLIDKIADNIKTALTDPEEAIFDRSRRHRTAASLGKLARGLGPLDRATERVGSRCGRCLDQPLAAGLGRTSWPGVEGMLNPAAKGTEG